MVSNAVGKYRGEIDGLRGFAVIAVIINHFNNDILPSGYLGVDIFFLISGYVITSSLLNRSSKNFIEFLSRFYERRIKRLVPALIFFVIVNSILLCLVKENPAQELKYGIHSLIGISNISLYRNSFNYFAESNNFNPFLHTWSLGVEEQFYLLFPLFFWFSGTAQKKVNGIRNLVIIILSLAICSLICFLYYYNLNQSAAYFLMPNRFWEIASGSLIFIGIHKRISFLSLFEKCSANLILLTILGTFFIPKSFATFTTVLIILLSGILLISTKKDSFAYSLLCSNNMIQIGLLSYSLYLWHWGILSFSHWTIGVHWWSIPIQILFLLIASIVSYRLIEKPFRESKWLKKTNLNIFAGMSLIFTSMFGVSMIRRFGPEYLYISTGNDSLIRPYWLDSNGNLVKSCMVEKFSSEYIEKCLVKSKNKTSTVYLLGDSHARNFLHSIKTLFSEYEVKYLTIGNRCGFVPSNLLDPGIEEKTNCSSYVKNVSLYIQSEAKEGDIVFIGQALTFHYQRKIGNEYFNHLNYFARSLLPNKAKVVLLDDFVPPIAPAPQIVCYKSIFRPSPSAKNCTSSYDFVKNKYKTFDMLAMKSSKEIDNMFYISLRDGFCKNVTCSQYSKNGTQVWHDSGHITDKASSELSELLRYRLELAGVKINSI